VFTTTTHSVTSFTLGTVTPVSGLGCSGNSISWTAVPGATGYSVHLPSGSTTATASTSLTINATGVYTVTTEAGTWSASSTQITITALWWLVIWFSSCTTP